MRTKKIVFMGTPDFAVPTLEALIKAPDMEVVGVVTQPDRPAGRGKQIRQSAVKVAALHHKLPVYQPEKLRGAEAEATLEAWGADVHVVAAYGQILKPEILSIPPYGSINVHASLLPRWRGAAPIQAAIRAGDKATGITIMTMDEGLDTGAMLLQESIPIAPDETGQSLHDKLMDIGGRVLLTAVRGYIDGDITPVPQNDTLATYAPQIKKEDGRIDWTQPADTIDRHIRAYTPFPGTYCLWNEQRMKVFAGSVVHGNFAAGQVTAHSEHPLVIGTGAGGYAPQHLQLPGKKVLSAVDFVNGNQDIIGAMLS